MMGPEERLEVLKSNNPFLSSSAGDPWKDDFPDVSGINDQAFQSVCQLINQKILHPSLNSVGLIQGEVGSGKTHLLRRIFNFKTKALVPFSFAYVQPIEDPDQTYRYLLREITVSLCYPTGEFSQTTQLEMLVAEMVVEAVIEDFYLRKNKKYYHKLLSLQKKKDALQIFKHHLRIPARRLMEIQSRSIDMIRKEHPDISSTFLKVLLQYGIEEKRPAVINWLRGEIIDKIDARKINVSDRIESSVKALEQESLDNLTSLGILSSRYHKSLVVCFDRLENLTSEAQVHSFGKMIQFLVDKAQAMLPIISIRSELWTDHFRKNLNPQIVSRCETNRFSLKKCTSKQAIAIIHSRLDHVLEDYADGVSPFSMDDLSQLFQQDSHSPAEVIMAANKKVETLSGQELPPTGSSALEKLTEEYRNQNDLVFHDFNHYPTDRAILKHALSLYLGQKKQEEEYHVQNLQEAEEQEKYISLEGNLVTSDSQMTPVIFMVDVELHQSAVGICLQRGTDYLAENPVARAVYIREHRSGFPDNPNWDATQEKFREFQEQGGKVIFLDKEIVGQWYSLVFLSYSVKEEDLVIQSGENFRAVTEEELAEFIQKNANEKTGPSFQNIDEALTT